MSNNLAIRRSNLTRFAADPRKMSRHVISALLTALLLVAVLSTPVAAGNRDAATLMLSVNGTLVRASVYPDLDRSILSASLARSLHLSPGRRIDVHSDMYPDAAGHQALPSPTLKLQNTTLHNLEPVIVADTTVARISRIPGARVVLGADFFSRRVVRFQFPSGSMSLPDDRTDPCAGASYYGFFGVSNDVATVPALQIFVDGRIEFANIDPQLDESLVLGEGNDPLPREVQLELGPIKSHVHPKRMSGSSHPFTHAFIVGKRAFGKSTLTIDGKMGRICAPALAPAGEGHGSGR